MSQWSALLKLTGAFQEQVLGLYSQELLPMEVRQYLAPWIESQDWKLAARDLSMANVQLQNLLEHLDNQYSRFTQEQEILQQHNFRRFKFNIQARYQADPQKLAALIRDILNHEKQILLEAQEMESQAGQPVLVSMKTGQQYEIDKRVTEVKERVQSVEQEVKFLEDLQEMFDFKYNNFQIIAAKSHPGDPHLIKKRDELQVQLNELDRKRKEVLDQMKLLLGLCETLLHFLQKELDEWLLKQKLSCIGATTNTCLKLLEGWITKTVEVFLQLRRLLSLLAELPTRVSYDGDPLKTDPPNLNHRLLEMLCCLLKRSFVVDKQPIMSYPCKRPLVIKTSSQFSVRARFLVNLPKLKHSMKVSYIVDKDPPNIKGYRRFNLLGTQPKAMEDLQGEGLVVDYKHLILKEQKAGTGGKGSKGASDGLLSVVEELHLITFTTLFDCQDLKLELEVTTLPFIIISNISQFVSAWASVLWFNLLSSDPKDVNFFSKPPAAPWQQLAEALSWQFSCSTKRGLNADQLSMLRKKLCDKTPEEQSTVSWNKFSKENMPHGSFSFWTWFDAILSLVKGHLENIWNDGYVMGFLSRRKEDSLLKTMMTGTFLLRFSESIREGGITCSWVEHLPNGTYTIHSVQPYTKKELSNIPLTEIIRNYQLLAEENIPENPLKYLYPIIPKDEAFGQYYEHRSDVTLEYKKYLKRRLIIVSERQVQDSQNCLSPGTPQFNETEAMDMNALIDGEILEALNINNILMNPDTDPMLPYVSMESSEALQ
ncbi:signal transducer and activator of transcription 2 [Rhinophrynus dorsalis]